MTAPVAAITREEATARGSSITLEAAELFLDVTLDGADFRTESVLHFTSVEGGETFLDALLTRIDSVELNGEMLDVGDVWDGARIALAPAAGRNRVRVVGAGTYSSTFEGLHRFVDPSDARTYLFSHFEAAHAQRVWALFDQPDIRARFQLTVRAPSHWRVCANSPTPEAVDDDGALLWRFAPTPVLSTYVLGVNAGQYAVIESVEESRVPVRILLRDGLADMIDADEVFRVVLAGIEFFEDLFQTDYPFAKLDLVVAPEFPPAMENAAAMTLPEWFVFSSPATDETRARRAHVLLHELAHMWFGDLVTMRWWDDLWLKEAFADWAATAAAEVCGFPGAWTRFAIQWKSYASEQDQLPSTHPIMADIPDLDAVATAFDGITYAKGAAVLKQLVAWVGEESFSSGMRRYLSRHAGGSATAPDLLAALDPDGARELGGWMDAWLAQSGINTIHTRVESDGAGVITDVSLRQSAPARSHRLAIGAYDWRGGRLERVARHAVDLTAERVRVPGLRGNPRPPLLLVNDDDLTYATVRLDPVSLRTAIAHLGRVADSLPRALLWGSIWDAAREGEIPVDSFLTAVHHHLADESDSMVRRTVLAKAVLGVRRYIADAPAAAARLGDSLRGMIPALSPDAQRQVALAFTEVAEYTDHLSELEPSIRGDRFLGLDADPELRWAALTALAAAGRVSDDDIVRALADDDTVVGREAAARVRAARLNDPHATWDRVISGRDPFTELRGAVAGLARQPAAVRADLAERYIVTIVDRWRALPYGVVRTLAIGLFPHGIPAAAVAVQALLADEDIPSPLRRILEEQNDDLLRARRLRADP